MASLVSLERSSSELLIEPSNSCKDKDVLELQKDEFSSQQACKCNNGLFGSESRTGSSDAV
eukprot:3810873-Pleurochrysis_carterae.AAC.1